jgi:hypothetical protein
VGERLALCRDLWAQHAFDPASPNGMAHPSLYDRSFSYPVLNPLALCVLNEGRAAVIPGDEGVCASMGLALKADKAP